MFEYLDFILEPCNFIKNFASIEHFKEWCRYGNIYDLLDMIDLYEKREYYEYCQGINQVIDEKINTAIWELLH